MSASSPSPPPLPPPTVPSQNSIDQIPPPPPPKPSTNTQSPSLSTLIDKSSSPPLTSVDLVPMHQPTDSHVESDHHYPSKPRPHRSCTCARPRLTPHHIHEPATSLWVNTPLLLVFRLAVTASLLGHLVFFSLRGDFSFRLYSTWNFVGLALAFLLVLICSLLHVLRDEDAHNDDQIPPVQSEGMVTDPERQPVGRPPLPDPKIARLLTRITVPLYQIFVTATLFGTIVYWAAIHDSSAVSISYPLVVLKVFAPASASLDFLLSLRMRFRFLYVLMYIVYNAIYVAALVLFDKLQGVQVYALFDPSVQSREQFIAKSAGIAAASVAAGLLIYLFSYLPVLSCFTGKKAQVKKKRNSVDGSDLSPTTASDVTSHSSGSKVLEDTDRDAKNTDPGRLYKGSRKEDGRNRSLRSSQKKDRLSLPIAGSGTMTPPTSAQWFRSSSARLVPSRSGSSIGSEDRIDTFGRSDSEKRSTWQALDQPIALMEDEYFAMPAVSPEREVIKLKPLPRVDSATSLPGILSRSSSGQMSRSGSRRMSRSGSRTRMARSQSDRVSVARSFTRSQSGSSMR